MLPNQKLLWLPPPGAMESKKKILARDLLFSVFQAGAQIKKTTNYISVERPQWTWKKIVRLLPGMKSHTVLPLYEKGWEFRAFCL